MENSILVALSAQGVLRRNLDVIANNLANLDTAGFKAERFMVAAHPIAPARPRTEVPGPTAFVRDLATVRDASDGRLDETGNALDLALRGEGFFVVSTPDGDRYTRNGHFRLDDTGTLVNEDGFPVQGQGGAPIVLAPRTRISTSPATGRWRANAAASARSASSASTILRRCSPWAAAWRRRRRRRRISPCPRSSRE